MYRRHTQPPRRASERMTSERKCATQEETHSLISKLSHDRSYSNIRAPLCRRMFSQTFLKIAAYVHELYVSNNTVGTRNHRQREPIASERKSATRETDQETRSRISRLSHGRRYSNTPVPRGLPTQTRAARLPVPLLDRNMDSTGARDTVPAIENTHTETSDATDTVSRQNESCAPPADSQSNVVIVSEPMSSIETKQTESSMSGSTDNTSLMPTNTTAHNNSSATRDAQHSHTWAAETTEESAILSDESTDDLEEHCRNTPLKRTYSKISPVSARTWKTPSKKAKMENTSANTSLPRKSLRPHKQACTLGIIEEIAKLCKKFRTLSSDVEIKRKREIQVKLEENARLVLESAEFREFRLEDVVELLRSDNFYAPEIEVCVCITLCVCVCVCVCS